MIKKLIGVIRLKPWLSIVTLLYLASMIAVSVPKSREISQGSDYWVFWQTGQNFIDKAELYNLEGSNPFNYPPFAAFIFQPLTLLSLNTSALVFFLLNSLLLLPLAIYLIYKILINIGVKGRKAEISLILATLFTLKFFWNNLVMYQMNFVVFVVILLGFYYLSIKKPQVAGVLFSIIALVKVIPVVLAGYVFLFHFSRRVVVSMLLTVILCLTVPASFRGGKLWINDNLEYVQGFMNNYVLEGEILVYKVNHGLKAAALKAFSPEARAIESVYPEDYPMANRLISLILLAFLGIIIVNGFLLFRRKTYFSIAYLGSILLFTHLYSGLTWTAHLVTLMFTLLPVLLIDIKRLSKSGKIGFYFFIALIVFLGIEGSDTLGKNVYTAIHIYDVHTCLLLGLFFFSSWVVFSKRSDALYQEGVII